MVIPGVTARIAPFLNQAWLCGLGSFGGIVALPLHCSCSARRQPHPARRGLSAQRRVTGRANALPASGHERHFCHRDGRNLRHAGGISRAVVHGSGFRHSTTRDSSIFGAVVSRQHESPRKRRSKLSSGEIRSSFASSLCVAPSESVRQS